MGAFFILANIVAIGGKISVGVLLNQFGVYGKSRDWIYTEENEPVIWEALKFFVNSIYSANEEQMFYLLETGLIQVIVVFYSGFC